MSLYTRVISRTEDPYAIVHRYHGNLWLIQSDWRYSLAAWWMAMGGGFLLCYGVLGYRWLICRLLYSRRTLGLCGGVTGCRAGGTFQMYCGIGRLSWLTSGF